MWGEQQVYMLQREIIYVSFLARGSGDIDDKLENDKKNSIVVKYRIDNVVKHMARSRASG